MIPQAWVEALPDAANAPVPIASKALSHWAYRFLPGRDTEDLPSLLRGGGKGGGHLALAAHLNRLREREPEPVRQAIVPVR